MNKPKRSELSKNHYWIYNHFLKNKILDKYCLDNTRKTLHDAIKAFKNIYGNKKPTRSSLRTEHGWIYCHLRRNNILDRYCFILKIGDRSVNDAIKEFKKIYGERKPTRTELMRSHRWIQGHLYKNGLLDKYCFPSQVKKHL